MLKVHFAKATKARKKMILNASKAMPQKMNP
jgi:hypothetical protein